MPDNDQLHIDIWSEDPLSKSVHLFLGFFVNEPSQSFTKKEKKSLVESNEGLLLSE